MIRRLLLAACLLALATPLSAHRASDAFVQLAVEDGQLSGSWEIALRDLEAAFTLDRNRDRDITWGELKAAQPVLAQQLPRHLQVAGPAGPCDLRITDLQVNRRSDGPYAWLQLHGTCPGSAAAVGVHYRFLFDLDPTHRAILSLGGAGGVQTAVLSPDSDRFPAAGAGAGRLGQFRTYLVEGVTHIWAGYDHLLFLACLLLPCVLVRRGGRWHPAARGRDAALEVLWVVTAFTMAHSVTLTLAVLGLVQLPSRIVEPVIALTVLLAALNNVWPLVTRYRSGVALSFGLVHGFGFAAALGELGLPSGALVLGLAGFNLGVELGQLAIVAALLPLLLLARTRGFYLPWVLRGGSLAVAALSGVWLMERLLGA